MAEANEFAWITGDVSELSHRRKIAAGGTGEVHEVCVPCKLLTSSCIIGIQMK